MSDNGRTEVPERYANDGRRETIDKIRDALGDDGFIAWCEGNTLKYRDRLGKKGADDEDKLAFYTQMADHVRGCLRVGYHRACTEYAADPRSKRPTYRRYVRHHRGTTDTEERAYRQCATCGSPEGGEHRGGCAG